MTITVTFLAKPPERDTFHQLLLDYYNTMIPMNPPHIAAILSADRNADEFWTEIDDYCHPEDGWPSRMMHQAFFLVEA